MSAGFRFAHPPPVSFQSVSSVVIHSATRPTVLLLRGCFERARSTTAVKFLLTLRQSLLIPPNVRTGPPPSPASPHFGPLQRPSTTSTHQTFYTLLLSRLSAIICTLTSPSLRVPGCAVTRCFSQIPNFGSPYYRPMGSHGPTFCISLVY